MTIPKVSPRTSLYEVFLPKHKIWRGDGDLRSETITCTAGKLWITQENDANDYILNSGEMFWITRPGTVLVQAIQDGQFIFSRIDASHSLGHN